MTQNNFNKKVLDRLAKGEKKLLNYKDKFPKLLETVGLRPRTSSGASGWFLGLSCSCGWFGSFDSAKSEPYDDEYFCYCPKCKEPEPKEALLRIVTINQFFLTDEEKKLAGHAIEHARQVFIEEIEDMLADFLQNECDDYYATDYCLAWENKTKQQIEDICRKEALNKARRFLKTRLGKGGGK